MDVEKLGESFERLTSEIFCSLGYSVERDVLMSGSQIDLVLKRSTGPFVDTYIVECKDHSEVISINLVRSFYSTLLAIRKYIPSANGIFVSRKSLTKEAKAFADTVGIQYITLDDLESRLLNLSSYVKTLIGSFKNSTLFKHYIPLDCYPKHFSGTRVNTKLSNLYQQAYKKYNPRHRKLLRDLRAKLMKLSFALPQEERKKRFQNLFQVMIG